MTDRYWRVMDQDKAPVEVVGAWPYETPSVTISDGWHEFQTYTHARNHVIDRATRWYQTAKLVLEARDKMLGEAIKLPLEAPE